METNINHRCGAVLGPTVLMFAALRFATTLFGATSTAACLVFVLSAMAGELFNPLFFSYFALYSMFFFSLMSLASGESKIFFQINVIYLSYKIQRIELDTNYKKKCRLNIIHFCDFSIPKFIKYYSFLLTNNLSLPNNNYPHKTVKYKIYCEIKNYFIIVIKLNSNITV